MDPHWHAFAYSGSRPTDAQGMDPASPYAAPETAFWLRKPQLLTSDRRAPFGLTDVDAALEWLASQAEAYPFPDSAMPLDTRMECARKHLEQPDDVVWAWYSGRTYVVRNLVLCPRDGYPCPTQFR